MKHENFAAFILTRGRPDRQFTYDSIRKSGYTGRVVFVLDDDDPTIEEHREEFPDDTVVTYSKAEVAKRTDSYTNSGSLRALVFARNESFNIAKELGLETFVQLDDDYTDWHHRVDPEGRYLSACEVRDLDSVFDAMLDFLYDSNALAVALAQGGDLLAGNKAPMLRRMSRKAMNSWFCRTDRPFSFAGLLNDDVNTYTTLGKEGALFATVGQVHLNQVATQVAEGGMSDVYRDGGTYVKSFYTVMANPSFAKVALMGSTRPRLHHSISWEHAVPKIVAEKYKRKRLSSTVRREA